MSTEVRCGNCGHWLGESPEQLVFIEHVAKSGEARIDPPRDLRMCRSCQQVNVFIRLAELDSAMSQAVG